MTRLSLIEQYDLRHRLNEAFKLYGLDVAVGLTHGGVAIRSQDERVDATNIGTVRPFDAS